MHCLLPFRELSWSLQRKLPYRFSKRGSASSIYQVWFWNTATARDGVLYLQVQGEWDLKLRSKSCASCLLENNQTGHCFQWFSGKEKKTCIGSSLKSCTDWLDANTALGGCPGDASPHPPLIMPYTEGQKKCERWKERVILQGKYHPKLCSVPSRIPLVLWLLVTSPILHLLLSHPIH